MATCLTVDCSDPNAVLSDVLDPTLDFLERHLAELDRLYLANLFEQLAAFQRALTAQCAAAHRVVPELVRGEGVEPELWRHLHRDFSQRLPVCLGQYLDVLRQARKDKAPHLQETLEVVLGPLARRSDPTLVPLPEDLGQLRHREGGWPGALQEAMNRVRSELTHRLLGLDAPLAETFAEAKEGLRQALEAAGLVLSPSLVSDAPWDGLARRAREASCPALAAGFQFVAGFSLTYFGFLHHRLRDALNPLTPDARSVPALTTASEAHEFLWDAVEHAAYLMREQGDGLLAEPAMARFAMVEEFVDQVVRRPQAWLDWERFTAAHRALLWPERFARAQEEAACYRRWTEAVSRVEQMVGRLKEFPLHNNSPEPSLT